jgi:hypothetical protein
MGNCEMCINRSECENLKRTFAEIREREQELEEPYRLDLVNLKEAVQLLEKAKS